MFEILFAKVEIALVEADLRFNPKKHRKASKNGHKTITRTFRVSEEWDDVLRTEAEKQGISVNVLVNQILRRYGRFDRWTRNSNVVSLTQDSLRKIVEEIPLDNIAKAGETRGPLAIQSIIDIMGLPSNYESFTFLMTNFFGSGYALWFRCHRHSLGNRDVFHLQHNLGRKWSVFLGNYFSSFLKTLNINCTTRVYDYAVNMSIYRPL